MVGAPDLPAIVARIRATPGITCTNARLLQEITSRTWSSTTQLDEARLACARTSRP